MCIAGYCIQLADTFASTFTVFAISVDLGSSTTFGPVTWAVGYVRNPSISYTTPRGNVEQLRPYFVTRYGVNNIGAAVSGYTLELWA